MVTLTDISALRLWAHEGLGGQLGGPCSTRGLTWSSGSVKELMKVAENTLKEVPTESNPLHVLVSGKEGRLQSHKVRNHIWSGALPAGSLYQLAPGIMIASPELCCLQMASQATLSRMVALEMECLGLYGRVPGPRGFLDRRPLISKEELRSFLDDVQGHRGVNNARRALRWALEGSRSPMETNVAVIFTLPLELGGYGFCHPTLNYVVRPTPEEYPLCQAPYYSVDVCWPRQMVALEYNSYMEHMGHVAFDHDGMKRNSLEALGWKFIEVTKGQLSGDALDVLARQLAKALGVAYCQPDPGLRDRLLLELA